MENNLDNVLSRNHDAKMPERIQAFLDDDRQVILLHKTKSASVGQRVLTTLRVVSIGLMGVLGSAFTVMGLAGGIYLGWDAVKTLTHEWRFFGVLGTIVGTVSGLFVGVSAAALPAMVGVPLIVLSGYLLRAHFSQPHQGLQRELSKEIPQDQSRAIAEASRDALKALPAPIFWSQDWLRHSVAQVDFLIKYAPYLSKTEKREVLQHFYERRQNLAETMSSKQILELEQSDQQAIRKLKQNPSYVLPSQKGESLLECYQRSFDSLKNNRWYWGLPGSVLENIRKKEGCPAQQLYLSQLVISSFQNHQFMKLRGILKGDMSTDNLLPPVGHEAHEIISRLKHDDQLPQWVRESLG